MKITATREQLAEAVSLAERITGKKESLPVLSCVLLEASGKKVSVRATNLEAGVEITVPASVEEKGVVAVPAGIFSQTLRSLGIGSVSLKEQEGNLSVESRGSKNLLKAIPHQEFPEFPSPTKGASFSISREKLLRALRDVAYAASPSMIRPELGSVSISIDNGALVCAATDSFRLAERVIKAATRHEKAELLLPLKHVNELTHVLEHIDGDDVEINAGEAQLSVSGDGVRYVCRIVEAQFPNYREIIPKHFVAEATLLKNDFVEMLRKARLFSGADQYVGLHVYPKKKIFSATARSADVGEMSDSIDAALSGEDVDLNFHVGYLADCLPSIEADSITIGFSGAGRALVIRGVSDTSFTYLVMPLNR